MESLIHTDIDGKFGWGHYNGFKVVICRENGFINVGKLCKKYGKQFTDWKRLNGSQELIGLMRVKCGREPVMCLRKGLLDISGTYVHPELFFFVVIWISPAFGLRVASMNNAQIIQEQEREIEALTQQLECAREKLDEVTEMSVPPGQEELREQLVLYRRKIDPSPDDFNHAVIRAQKRSAARTLFSLQKDYPDLEVLLVIDEQPNTVNLYNRFRETFTGARFINNSIRLEPGVSESELVDGIKHMHAKRKQPLIELNEILKKQRIK